LRASSICARCSGVRFFIISSRAFFFSSGVILFHFSSCSAVMPGGVPRAVRPSLRLLSSDLGRALMSEVLLRSSSTEVFAASVESANFGCGAPTGSARNTVCPLRSPSVTATCWSLCRPIFTSWISGLPSAPST
jgi:hypothetical protein